ncbi:hypothetical protein ABZS76_33295 [Streptomyces sp. NPDC005562]|uniref:hypothetical protein n=1 Tax=Streptomyces sp. NPDC005562 TaxID=3154890 RepID=UPI0033BE63F3
MPLNSVPGQVAAGPIDGLLRDNPGDGTLGLPDYSPVPYTYAPLLGPVEGDTQWVLDQWRKGGFAAFKGSPDGLGALRSTGADRGAFGVEFICEAAGVKVTSPDGSRAPDYTWGPRDFALAIRHPGTTTWTAASPRAYLAFTAETKTLGIRITTSAAEGPWDAEVADSAPIMLGGGFPDPWDGAAHTAYVACFGSNVLCVLDGKWPFVFRAPRAYKRNTDGTVDTTVFSNLPTTGRYGGYDNRNEQNFLYGWQALQGASGDLFYYDMGPTTVQTPPGSTYTPSTLPSGETWAITGTATASKNGLQLAASSTATFIVQAPHGYTCTRWGVTQAQAGLMFRRQNSTNYYILTSTGTARYTNGTPVAHATFTTPLKDGDHVIIVNGPTYYQVFVNGMQVAAFTALVQGESAGGIGFFNPAGGTSQWRYLVHQPVFTAPSLPTA